MTPDPQPKRRNRPNRPRNYKRFDDDNVLTLPVRRCAYMAWDAGTDAVRGLGILISPKGTRSFRVIFYYPGSSKPHTMHLGRVGEVTLAEARERALEARMRAREGIDPKAEDLTKSADFKSAVEDYVKHWQIGKRGNATAHECQRILLKVRGLGVGASPRRHHSRAGDRQAAMLDPRRRWDAKGDAISPIKLMLCCAPSSTGVRSPQ